MLMKIFIGLMERGFLPDSAIRWGVRRLCRERLSSLQSNCGENAGLAQKKYAQVLRQMPLAQATQEANEQHYEVPTDFFLHVLGKNRKYSSAFFESDSCGLDQAEDAALAQSVEHAELQDGMNILELGCGWGSLTLYMAKRFPNAKIVAISNSNTQRLFIEAEAEKRSLPNIEVKTLNLAEDAVMKAIPEHFFDRVVSVEMFEHFKNYQLLLHRVALWLKKDGKVFIHIFTHQKFSYPFETEGEDNWMGKYFFTGGQMPSQDLLSEFQDDLILEKKWNWNGTHYQKTSECWLQNLDAKKTSMIALFHRSMPLAEANRWFHRWRVFFISCAELFGFNEGSEWAVTHYLFHKK